MRIRLFTNIYFAFIILIFSLLIMLASRALSTLEDITGAERQKYRSLQLASELFHSSEDLTKMARSYVVTGEPIYEHFFFQILDIRNGKRPRPEAHLVNYWDMDGPLAPTSDGSGIPLVELMRREGFSERELALLQQSQKNSDDLVNLERQAFAASKGGWLKVWEMDRQIAVQEETNRKLQARNATLDAEVRDLKQGVEAIEERARNELGMIKEDETFFHVLEDSATSSRR